MYSETAAAETTSQPEPVQPTTNSQEEPATQGQLPESAAAEATSTMEASTDSTTRG